MMSRSSSVILVVTSLAAGLVLGFSLGRGGPVVSAQVGGSLRGQAGSMTPERAARRAAEVGRQDSQIYDQLAKEYEQFAHVDRMFELVSKAVSPSVVHIVAQKTVRHEESQRIKKFEETGSGVIVRNDKNPGLYVLTNHHVVEGGKSAQDPDLPARRPHPDTRADLERRQGRHRRAQARPRRPAGGPAGQQRYRGRGDLGPGPGQSVRPDALGEPGNHQRPEPAHGRACRTSRTRTSSRPTRRSTRAIRADRWST